MAPRLRRLVREPTRKLLRRDDSPVRPHSSLGYRTPVAYADYLTARLHSLLDESSVAGQADRNDARGIATPIRGRQPIVPGKFCEGWKLGADIGIEEPFVRPLRL
jgi:hypothetical protein